MLITNYYEKDEKVIFIGRDINGNRVRESIDEIEPYYFDENDNKVSEITYGKTYGINLRKVDFTRVIKGITNYYDFKENKSTEENITPRICIIDIETNDKNGFPDIKIANEPILCYVVYDNYNDFYYIHGLDKVNVEKLADKIGHLRFKLFVHNTESEMINWFIKYLNSNQAPDYISGYNVDFFDIKYMKNRSKALGLQFDLNGVVVFDLEKGYIHIKYSEPSYKLDDVAKKELGYGKIERQEIWKMNPLDRYYYCYFDVFITKELDKKLNIINYHLNIAILTNVNINETYYPTTFVYSILMYESIKEGVKLPIYNINEEIEQEVEGALVIEPSKGIYKNVICLDVKGSYPGIIITKNISPETIIYNDKNEPIGFDTTYKGLLPKVIEKFLNEREKLKRLMKESKTKLEKDGYDSIQYALKTVTNAFYGVFIKNTFKLFNYFVASSITEGGRENINRMKEYLENNGYEIRYGDTDSVFLETKTENILEEGKFLVENINKMFREKNGENNHVIVEFEKYYSFWLQVGVKKRYAGFIEFPEKKLQIKGFEVVRRGSSKYTKETQKKFITLLLTDKVKAIKFYKEEEEKWKKKNIPLSRIGIEKSMHMDESEYKNNNEMIKALRNAEKRGIKIDRKIGKMRIYYLEGGEPVGIPMEAEVPKKLKIDYEQHKIVCFEKPLKKLRDLLGEQKNLNDFFEW
jgi:DNA polymerase I